MRVTVPARRSATKTMPWTFTATPRGWRNPRAQTLAGASATGKSPATLGACAADGKNIKRLRPTSLAGRGIRDSEPIGVFVARSMREQVAAAMPDDDSRTMLTARGLHARRLGHGLAPCPAWWAGRLSRETRHENAAPLSRPRGHLPRIHPVEELRPAVARSGPGMLAQHALVDVGAPARRVGEPDVSVADHRRARDERALPGYVVDVDLHDAHVGEHGAEVQGGQVGQMAVVVVRRDVDLACFRQPPDLHRLREAVPRHVDDRHVDRMALEERPVLAQGHQALARGQAG